MSGAIWSDSARFQSDTVWDQTLELEVRKNNVLSKLYTLQCHLTVVDVFLLLLMEDGAGFLPSTVLFKNAGG